MKTSARPHSLSAVTTALTMGKLLLEPVDAFPFSMLKSGGQKNFSQPYWSVQIVTRGRTDFFISGRRFSGNPGDLTLVGPGVLHDYFHQKGTTGCVAFFRLIPDQRVKTSVSLEEGHIFSPQAWDLFPIIKLIAAEVKRSHRWVPSRLTSLFSLLFTDLMILEDSGKKGRQIFSNGQTEVIQNFVLENIRKKFSSDPLARQMRLSRPYFSKKFRNTYGVNPKVFFMREKLRHASLALQSGEASVAEIAGRFGYESVPTFSRQYLRLFGTTPGKARPG